MRLSNEEAADVMRVAGFEPLEPYRGVDSPWLSRCQQCSRLVRPTLSNIRAGKRCRYCSGHAVIPDDAVTVMREAGLEPLVSYPGANRPWKCRCIACDYTPSPTLNSVRRGHKCRNCAGQVVDPVEAEQVMRAVGLEPETPYPGADTPWPCRCTVCGGSPSPTLSSVRAGCGCKYCGRIKSGQARRVPEADAIAAMRKSGLEPIEPYPGTNNAWQCRCATCGRTVSPSLATIRGGTGTGCSYCAHKAVDPADAEQVMRTAHLEPQAPYPGALEPWPCICTVCGKLVSPILNNIRKGQGCAYCGRRKVDASDAEAVMLDAGLQPLAPYPGAGKKWRCRCMRCGNTVTPVLNNTRKGVGCRHCATSGFDYNAPAVVYLVCHPLGSIKVGICGADDRNTRIAAHQRNGWYPYQQLRLPFGEQAHQIEQAVLARLRREYQLTAYMSAETMPQGGWTETFDAEIVSADVVWRIVQAEARQILKSIL